MWKLVIEDDEGKRTVVPLTRESYSIGRKEGNTIRLTERNVSRQHAKLHKANGAPQEKPTFTLEDMSSYNGVYVNGLRVADKQVLAHGDLIQIGDYRIVLQDDSAEAGENVEDEAQALGDEDLKETIPQPVPVPSPLRATNATFLEKPNRLVVLAGPTPGEEFPLVGDRLTIGRAEDATISINHNSVSRLHCEVHALGEGRFEIVDKGSSNGVRVNGADLRRGIIEAGDIIELGDVKFKFVGEGQLFRPGTSESQQLAAISQRAATEVIQVRPKSSLLPAVALGTVIAIAVIVGVAVKLRGSPEPEPAPAPSITAATDTTPADIAMLQDARRMADIGDVDGAHQKALTLPAGSALHGSDDFKYIEHKWVQAVLQRADMEMDPGQRIALLQKVVGDVYADPTFKRLATDKISAAQTAPPPTPTGATKPPTVVSAPVHAGGRPTVIEPTPTPVPHPTPHQTTSIVDLVTSPNPADWAKARDYLEPRVFGHKASADEVRMLRSLCKAQSDTACLTAIRQLYP